MYARIIGILICVLLVGVSIIPSICGYNNPYDEIDQKQTICDTYDIIAETGSQRAQSFQPMKNTLTRVRLLMYKYGNPFEDIILILRNSINGTDLATSSKPANILPLEPAMWIEFNFANISVQPRQTYYLIVLGNDYWDRSAHLYWGRSSSDVYLNGSSWRYDYPTDKWIQKPDNDYCFKTYGFNNSPPNTPTITGKTNGKAGEEYEYCLNYVVDPDGDNVCVWWDWGDGTNTGWLGPYDSGKPICANHSWSEEGTYTIKAKLKDPYGSESDWSSLEVSMPKNKVIKPLFLQRFFQRFPFLVKILNQKISINSLATFNSIFNSGFHAVLFTNVEASFDVVYATGIGMDNFLLLVFLHGENGDVKLEPRIGIFQHDVHITGSTVELTMIWFKGKITYEYTFPPSYYNITFEGTALCALVNN